MKRMLNTLTTKRKKDSMKGVKHYKKDGSVHKGGMHKMANGVKLFHYGELNNKAKAKARKSWKK